MTVNGLLDTLMNMVVDGKLKGDEQIVDPAIFAVTGVEAVEMHDGGQYVRLTSGEYDEAQDAEPTSFS